MELIVNEVELKKKRREEEKKEKLKKEGKTESNEPTKEKEKQPVVVCRTTTDIQKRKLDKLMSNMNKEAYIPEPRKEWKPRDAPEFVRHVMGSSAGAGSGEFHVYRGIRKRENKRQEFLDRKAVKDQLDDEFDAKLEENKRKAEDATAAKRVKRQKKKKKKKMMAKNQKKNNPETNEEKVESSEEEDYEEGDVNAAPKEPHFVAGGE